MDPLIKDRITVSPAQSRPSPPFDLKFLGAPPFTIDEEPCLSSHQRPSACYANLCHVSLGCSSLRAPSVPRARDTDQAKFSWKSISLKDERHLTACARIKSDQQIREDLFTAKGMFTEDASRRIHHENYFSASLAREVPPGGFSRWLPLRSR